MARMTSWLRVALGVGLVVAAAAACGDDPPRRPGTNAEAGAAGQTSEPGTAGTPGVTTPGGAGNEAGGPGIVIPDTVDVPAYCDLVAEAYSTWLANCYGSAQYPAADAADLIEETRLNCLRTQASVDAGRLAFDEDAARVCLTAMDVDNCDGFDFIAGLADCQNVFAPLAEIGDDCFPAATSSFAVGGARSECLNGYCATTNEMCPGACTAFKENADPCVASVECGPERYCTDEGCAPRKAAFGECSGDACELGLTCVYPPAAMLGLCVQRSTVGQACSEEEQCSTGFYCIEGTCHSKVATGEACEVSRNCADGERCLDRDGSGPTCGPPGSDDVPCLEPSDCLATHYCPISAMRVCTPRVAIGQPCTSGQCETDAWCNSETGECQAQGGEGDSCSVGGFPAGSLACQPPLDCMGDGACHGTGGDGDPCNPGSAESCEAGLFCSRADFTCQPAGAMGDLCNPFSPVSCAGDLGCLCDDPACEPDAADPMVEDSLHTCAPRRATGEPCFTDYECAEGSSCLGGAAAVCDPDPIECLPN